MPTKTFSLYLAKREVRDFEDVLTQKARERIKAGDLIMRNSTALGSRARAYIFQNTPGPPKWLSDVKEVFSGLPDIANKSSCALVVFAHAKRIFVTSFAHGWQYIDDAKIETDFGLKVVINSLSDSKVKRIDRSHLGEALKGVSQSAFQRDLQAFGIDEALDLVRRITGPADDEFADSIAGSNALKITREMVLSDLAEIADEALTRSQSEDYKETAFRIIDKVRPILDQTLIAALDEEAIKIIRSDQDNFELSMPGWSEEDVVYYGFKGLHNRKRYPDLLMMHYRQQLGNGIDSLDVDAIVSRHGVIAEFANDAMAKKHWSIKKALVGSVAVNDGLYAISEGEWYRLDRQFKEDVDASFRQLIEKWDFEPQRIKKLYSDDSKKGGFERELDYNRRCAASYGQICLDQEILQVPSIPYGKFEACDLLDIRNKKLIHVKKSSRQSSVLSHFFKQGSNSARILKNFPKARDALIDKVRQLTDDGSADELKTSLGNSLADWTVEFHIIDAPRPDGSFTIPFFSRITLRDEALMLKGMTFGVTVKFIST